MKMNNFNNKLLRILDEESAKEEKAKKEPLKLVKEKRLQYYSGWNKKEKTGQMEKEIGRIKKSDTVEIVVKIDNYGGGEGVTIREFLTSEKYTGFTKQGTRIPKKKWDEFKEIVNKVGFKE